MSVRARTKSKKPEKLSSKALDTLDDAGDGPVPDDTQQLVDNGGSTPTKKSKVKDSKEKHSKKSKKTKASDSSDQSAPRSFVWGKLIKYMFLLIFVPPFLNYTSLQREGIELKPKAGELYDVGFGQKLFLSCSGQGPPTVLLDAPTGMSSDVWVKVVPSIAKHARVCVYDRAGLGFSERPINKTNAIPENPQQASSEEDDKSEKGPKQPLPSFDKRPPFTVERMVEDLHRLITSASQQPQPFILVGAELGAVVAQFYSHTYPSEVHSVVLVNPLSDNLFEVADGVWTKHWFANLVPVHQSLQLAAATGISRLGLLVGLLKQPIRGDDIEEEVINRQKYLLCNPRHQSTVVDEHYFVNETFSQMRTFRRIKKAFPSSVRTTILTGNYYDEEMPANLNKAWAQAQHQLLSQHFPTAQHLVVNGADRRMLYRQPDSIVEAVLRAVKRWKRTM